MERHLIEGTIGKAIYRCLQAGVNEGLPWFEVEWTERGEMDNRTFRTLGEARNAREEDAE